MNFIIADTGKRSDTKYVVESVRDNIEKNRKHLERIGEITEKAKRKIQQGDSEYVGKLMNMNHELLKKIDVSSQELDGLVDVAIKNGALGAKMAGAGRGGCIIALVDEENKDKVKKALKDLSKKIYFAELK